MTKTEMTEILHKSCKTVNEGITSSKNKDVYPRIVYWDYAWEDVVASGEEYSELETYQISFYSRTPRHENLIDLRKNLREVGCHPTIYHEYVEEDKVWHSYFSLEVVV